MKKLLCLLVLLGLLSGGALRAVSMITAGVEHDEDYSAENEGEEEHDEGFAAEE